MNVYRYLHEDLDYNPNTSYGICNDFVMTDYYWAGMCKKVKK